MHHKGGRLHISSQFSDNCVQRKDDYSLYSNLKLHSRKMPNDLFNLHTGFHTEANRSGIYEVVFRPNMNSAFKKKYPSVWVINCRRSYNFRWNHCFSKQLYTEYKFLIRYLMRMQKSIGKQRFCSTLENYLQLTTQW